MIERRPVSSVLQSPAFRRQLENVIRGGLVSASHSRRTPVTTAPTPSAASRQPRQPVHAARRNPRPGALEVAPTESSSLPTGHCSETSSLNLLCPALCKQSENISKLCKFCIKSKKIALQCANNFLKNYAQCIKPRGSELLHLFQLQI